MIDWSPAPAPSPTQILRDRSFCFHPTHFDRVTLPLHRIHFDAHYRPFFFFFQRLKERS